MVTNYAHPDTRQLEFYRRLASWVAPAGTILIVGHLHHHDHDHPEGSTATLAGINDLFARRQWHIDASYENTRTMNSGGRLTQLHDVVVRAHRIA